MHPSHPYDGGLTNGSESIKTHVDAYLPSPCMIGLSNCSLVRVASKNQADVHC